MDLTTSGSTPARNPDSGSMAKREGLVSTAAAAGAVVPADGDRPVAPGTVDLTGAAVPGHRTRSGRRAS